MSSTIQLQRSVTLASAFLSYAPLTMSSSDPALSNADWVRQVMLSPPFAWRWNRASVQFQTQLGQTDYKVSAPALGWLEKAVIYLTPNGNKTYELKIENNVAVETVSNQPTTLSAQFDDDSGNITFRLLPSPDDVYTVEVTYQKSAPTFQALTDFWTPIPDYLSYIYNEGFQARCYDYRNDPRAGSAMQSFYQLLTAASQGISDDAKNLFLTERLNTIRQTSRVQQGRG